MIFRKTDKFLNKDKEASIDNWEAGKFKTAIIISCYNEEKRILKSNIDYLIVNTNATLFFANDGSTDTTVLAIENIINGSNGRCCIINFKNNEGKVNTIYKAINQINNENEFNFIGYFDTDFSTPQKEIKRLLEKVQEYYY